MNIQPTNVDDTHDTGADTVAVPRIVLARLTLAARHQTMRVEPVQGAADQTVNWVCHPDCPPCAANEILKGADDDVT